MGRRVGMAGVVAAIFLGIGWGIGGAPRSLAAEEARAAGVPLGLPMLPVPDDNPMSPQKVALGRQLYFDKRLSVDDTVACASCHHPDHGWSNGQRFATGIRQQVGGRSAPTILNAAYHRFQFWDGRADSLEEQALGPIQNPIEMGMPSLAVLEEKLNRVPHYRSHFHEVFGTEVTGPNIARAIAAFERTILSGDSPFDRFQAGQADALSPAMRRGLDVFFNKAHCSACHPAPHFTDRAFHNVGVGTSASEPDSGRVAISKLEGDRGSFKTPTLRDVARTAPYMHDGSLPTLEAVIEHYVRGGFPHPQLDEEIYPLRLSESDQEDLIVFLREGLSSSAYPDVDSPDLPP